MNEVTPPSPDGHDQSEWDAFMREKERDLMKEVDEVCAYDFSKTSSVYIYDMVMFRSVKLILKILVLILKKV